MKKKILVVMGVVGLMAGVGVQGGVFNNSATSVIPDKIAFNNIMNGGSADSPDQALVKRTQPPAPTGALPQPTRPPVSQPNDIYLTIGDGSSKHSYKNARNLYDEVVGGDEPKKLPVPTNGKLLNRPLPPIPVPKPTFAGTAPAPQNNVVANGLVQSIAPSNGFAEAVPKLAPKSMTQRIKDASLTNFVGHGVVKSVQNSIQEVRAKPTATNIATLPVKLAIAGVGGAIATPSALLGDAAQVAYRGTKAVVNAAQNMKGKATQVDQDGKKIESSRQTGFGAGVKRAATNVMSGQKYGILTNLKKIGTAAATGVKAVGSGAIAVGKGAVKTAHMGAAITAGATGAALGAVGGLAHKGIVNGIVTGAKVGYGVTKTGTLDSVRQAWNGGTANAPAKVVRPANRF